MSRPNTISVGRPSERPDLRPPLPAGHPVSWGVLTRGTVLDGKAWPSPPMTRAAPGAASPARGDEQPRAA